MDSDAKPHGRKRAFDAFEQELANAEQALDAELTDVMCQDSARIQGARRRLDDILDKGAKLSGSLRLAQMQIAADELRRRKELDAAAVPAVARMTSNLAFMPIDVLRLILKEAMRPAHFAALAFHSVMKPWETARVLRKDTHSPASTSRIELRVRQLRTVCRSFAAALERCFDLHVRIDSNWRYVPKKSEMRVMLTNLYGLCWPAVRVLHITVDALSVAFRNGLERVLYCNTSRLPQRVPNLAAIVIDTRNCTDVLKKWGYAGQVLVPTIVYRSRDATRSLQSVIIPNNLRHFKTGMLPNGFSFSYASMIVTLSIYRFDDGQMAVRPKWPMLEHLMLRRIKEFHDCLGTEHGYRARYPKLRALTYTPWLITGMNSACNDKACAIYARELQLAADAASIWFATTGNRMMLDMHAFYRTCYNVATGFAYLRVYDKDYDPSEVALKIGTAVEHLLSSVPLVLLFPRASACAMYAPIDEPGWNPYLYNIPVDKTMMPFVSFLLDYGDRINAGSQLQIVESAFMQRLLSEGEPLPGVELAQIPSTLAGEPRRLSAARWLQRNLSYSPAFEDTL
jgi:hypothetical protein